MNSLGFIAVGVGAALGAWLRWVLGLLLNSSFPAIPPGTLVANLVGGYVIGAAVGAFTLVPAIAPEWRLLIVTGFCGGLTTFSTFSAELAALLQPSRPGLLALAVVLHVGGSLLATLGGIGSARWAITSLLGVQS
ncbi:MAG TPA: fluoride efflux transporter CrcB [Povalibacter sp.]|uniref:fluoride efflux transporter CrcB n=1 Tax=Povalibacter sp. TaxID=1962978 RepID=UPI002C7F642C|nr:fluoride efflux transporter CrcB [Povalibacter sp.]HMN45798.1 fluoride efflux transporter CrcB [Povalibacter sp.]